MIGLDTNVIIHLLVPSQKEHPSVKKWLLHNQEELVTTQTNIAEFLRLITHHKVFSPFLKLTDAIDLLENFLRDWDIDIVEESETWWIDLREPAKKLATLSGNEIFDARIALCLRFNGVAKIATLDDDFLKFSFLKVIKPL